MGQCEKDVTSLLRHWSYVFLALTHWYIICYDLCSTCINSSPPSAAYMHQGIGSALVQIMACPIRRQAIIKTSAGLLSIGPLATNFSEILVKIRNLSFTKIYLKLLSAKWRPFCPGGDELTLCCMQHQLLAGHKAPWKWDHSTLT